MSVFGAFHAEDNEFIREESKGDSCNPCKKYGKSIGNMPSGIEKLIAEHIHSGSHGAEDAVNEEILVNMYSFHPACIVEALYYIVMRLLIINPGSTSTKVSVFDDEIAVFTESVFHDAPVLLAFNCVNDQLPFRKNVVMNLLEKHDIPLSSIDVFVGRGGTAYSQCEGVMYIDQRLYEDTRDDKGGSDHPAKLGVMMAYEFGTELSKPMFTLNPTNVDEFIPLARITGVKGIYRRAQSHVLNQKGIARIHAAKLGKCYEDCSFIVSHIDGGITISAHRKGRMIDGTEGAGGDGPFTPTRLGSIPIMETARYLENHKPQEMEAMCSRSGGFVSHFGTSDASKVHALAEKGDEHSALVWETMIYQISKSIGSMATVLEGNVDAILLTGGLVRYKSIVDGIVKRCSWIAPVTVYPGEVEQEELAFRVLRVMRGKEEARRYTGKPVFSGFPWDGNS